MLTVEMAEHVRGFPHSVFSHKHIDNPFLSHYGYLWPELRAITTPTTALIELGPTLFCQGAY